MARPLGATGKVNRSMKETVSQTLEWLQKQPRVNMREWAMENPTEFYRIASRLIPTELNIKAQVHKIEVVYVESGSNPIESTEPAQLTEGNTFTEETIQCFEMREEIREDRTGEAHHP